MKCDFKIQLLKKANSQIASDISLLSKQLLPDNPEISVEKLTKIVNDQSSYVYVALNCQNKIVGMIMMIAFYTLENEYKAFLENLVVDKLARKKGIASALIKKTLETAKKLKINTLHLTSRPSRIPANLLYKKIGFELYKTNHYKIKLS